MSEISLRQELRDKRISLLISSKIIAKALNVSITSVTAWERGETDLCAIPNFGELYRQYLQDCEDGKIKYKTNLQTGKTVSLQQFSPGQSTQAIPPNSESSDESNNTDMLGKINHPNYYQGKSFEAIDFIDAHCLNFNLGNVIKYITRAGKKDGEDSLTALRKALWYLQREINHQEAQS